MLDTDTKRRIDTARDILVGKVPDPKSQVEQITIAFIYKFMDDMGAESEELGGKPQFIEGDPFITRIPLPAEAKAAAESSVETVEKTVEKSSEKILRLITDRPEISARELADALNLTQRAVEKQISKLQEADRLRRIGPDKGGHWEVRPTAAPRKEEV